ncbi:SURF1 family protein [Streptomyces sp. NBC_01808]|uniref:SURF1 family cytochrome oxidase biogenesis protein n=1 Tax=Streptomyces sp. NBC_01808 TaxID=2975947 RepID=UPI002DD944DF|nr:SURF1 family protein [Streptomyces sp. NBC_01808]WSA37051.1 SURF1 family protein [Streptomyces sp. NBC_01808]
MYRFLLSRQWVIVTLVAVLLIPVMIQLGFWQLHRHEDRVARNDLVARNLKAEPVPADRLMREGRTVPREDTWRTVTATGAYEPEREVVVRQRLGADDKQGYFVVTPLRLTDGSAVLVNRGWVPAGADLTAFPKVPPPPAGEVTVTGRLRPDETTGSGIRDKAGLPDRQVMLINSTDEAADGLPGPVLGGFVELVGTSPKAAGKQPEPVPEPDHSSIGVHIAYAIQWWIFAAAVPFGWWVLVRRERRDREAAAAKAAEEETAAPAEPAKGGEAPGGTPADGAGKLADAPARRAADDDPAPSLAPAEQMAAD